MFLIILFPIFGAFFGWLGLRIFTILMKNKVRQDSGKMLQAVSGTLLQHISIASLADELTNEASMNAMRPEIEKQIDQFIQHKLQEKIPLLAMFAGDKIVAQVRELLLAEIFSSLPSLLKGYIEKADIEGVLSQKIQEIPREQVTGQVDEALKPFYNRLQVFGAGWGFALSVLFIIAIFMYNYIFLQH